jgi:hypothetical protein
MKIISEAALIPPQAQAAMSLTIICFTRDEFQFQAKSGVCALLKQGLKLLMAI